MGMWYRNISTQPQSVPVGNGNVVAVRPQGDVEVEAETPGLVRLRKLGKIARTGRPQHVVLSKPEAVRDEAERKRANTEFAQRVQERGRAASVEDAKRQSAVEAQRRAGEAQRAAEATPEAPVDAPAGGEELTVETGATPKRSKRDKARA